MSDEAISPDEYEVEAQSGVDFTRPKDLQAAGPEHPLFRRAIDEGVLTEEQITADDGDSVIPWNVPAMVLKNMSEGLYETESAAIREFESNAETAVLKAKRAVEGDYTDPEVESIKIVEDDYQPIIEVYYRKDQNKVIIRDNGKGIESATILNVVRKIGATTARDSGELTGQFGMGLASFLKLIGLDNSMIMRTHSRITDENFAAYVNLGGFDPIVGGLGEDSYGTEFEMIHSGDLDADLRDAVETYSEWLRVPVHYEEYDADGKLVFDEDWGGKTFVDTYSDDNFFAEFEVPGLLTATMSPDAEETTLLNSIPIERNSTSDSSDSFYPFDVRLLDESGAIVAVPDEDGEHTTEHDLVGKTPVSDAEYNIMSEGQRSSFVRESDVPDDAITLPVPTSSRDTLQENEEFWEWVAERVNEEFKQGCRQIYNNFDKPEDVLKLTSSVKAVEQ